MSKSRLVLIDGHSLLFRAYFAFPPNLSTQDGELVNAVFGFTSILLSVIEELGPTHIAVCFDSEGPTLRKEGFELYKAHRKPMPDDLIPQIARTHDVVKALDIPIFEMKGYEADDLIGTLAIQAAKLGTDQESSEVETVIVTGDHDILQLVQDGKIQVFFPKRGKKPATVFDEAGVVEEMGIRVDQVVDYKALAGDSSDNIPGVRGIGPKTAVQLLQKFETLQNLYQQVDAISTQFAITTTASDAEKSSTVDPQAVKERKKVLKQAAGKLEISPSVLSKLIDDKQMAFKSQELARIMIDVPVQLVLDQCKVSGYDKQKTLILFEQLSFKSLVNRLPSDEFEVDVQEALF